MEFLLAPWDRNRPRVHPPLADSVVAIKGKNYGLRAQNGILFFRDAANREKTWAIAAPLTAELEGDVAGREAFFRREFERGNVARYLVHLDSYLERTVPLFFRGDGTGWCREAWNRDDIPFSHSVSMHVLMEGSDKAITDDMGDVQSQLEGQLANMDWPADVKWSDGEEGVEWLCGSREGLEEVLGWVCDVEGSFWEGRNIEDVQLTVASETPFSRAYISQVEVGRAAKRDELSLEADMQSDEVSVSYGFEAHPMPSRRFWTLCDLALDENTPIGTYWEYHDYGMGRCADGPNPIWIYLTLGAPTEEQIEVARAQLRAWLQSKVPGSEIEAILGDETRSEFPKTEW